VHFLAVKVHSDPCFLFSVFRFPFSVFGDVDFLPHRSSIQQTDASIRTTGALQ
jgi:hypothetical protein